MRKIIHWSSRVLAILFVLYIALFALDVFSDFSWLGLIMNLLPAIIVAVLAVVAWHRPILGGILFVLAGAAGFVLLSSWLVALPVIIPAIIIGALFIVSRIWPEEKAAVKKFADKISSDNLTPVAASPAIVAKQGSPDKGLKD